MNDESMVAVAVVSPLPLLSPKLASFHVAVVVVSEVFGGMVDWLLLGKMETEGQSGKKEKKEKMKNYWPLIRKIIYPID